MRMGGHSDEWSSVEILIDMTSKALRSVTVSIAIGPRHLTRKSDFLSTVREFARKLANRCLHNQRRRAAHPIKPFSGAPCTLQAHAMREAAK